jgi:hypothetical protein
MTAAESALAALREVFPAHPRLTLTTTPFIAPQKLLTRLWWRDQPAGVQGKLADVADPELSAVTLALLGELRRLRTPKAKGATA